MTPLQLIAAAKKAAKEAAKEWGIKTPAIKQPVGEELKKYAEAFAAVGYVQKIPQDGFSMVKNVVLVVPVQYLCFFKEIEEETKRPLTTAEAQTLIRASIRHEVRHIWQIKTRRLAYRHKTDTFFWEGKKSRYKNLHTLKYKTYRSLPWEKDAFKEGGDIVAEAAKIINKTPQL